jgi:hypothetical protein
MLQRLLGLMYDVLLNPVNLLRQPERAVHRSHQKDSHAGDGDPTSTCESVYTTTASRSPDGPMLTLILN